MRGYHLDRFPIHNETDSLNYVWAGTSMFKNIRKPISNSIFVADFTEQLVWYSEYNPYDTIRRAYFNLIDPFMDHPPLAMFFIALPAKLLGFNQFTPVPQIIAFFPALIFSILSLGLTYLFAKKLFGYRVAILSLVIYSLSPIYVFSHRESLLENFLTPFYLLTFLLVNSYLHNTNKVFKKSQLIAISILCAMVIWIKIPSIILTAIVCFWFIKNQKVKSAIYVFISGATSMLSYIFFGLSINKDHFLHTLSIQGTRGMNPNIFLKILTSVDFYSPFPDGMYFFGFLSIFILFFTQRYFHRQTKLNFFLLNFIFLLLGIVITTSQYNNFFWYRIPLYPFLSIASGIYLSKLLKANNLFYFLPFYLLSFYFVEVFNISFQSNFLRIIYLFPIITLLINLIIKQQFILTINKFLIRAILLIVVIMNILITLKYPQISCLNNFCLSPTKIVISDN